MAFQILRNSSSLKLKKQWGPYTLHTALFTEHLKCLIQPFGTCCPHPLPLLISLIGRFSRNSVNCGNSSQRLIHQIDSIRAWYLSRTVSLCRHRIMSLGVRTLGSPGSDCCFSSNGRVTNLHYIRRRPLQNTHTMLQHR